MTGTVEVQLANHDARIEALEGSRDKIEAKLDKLIGGMLLTLVGILVQIFLKLVKG